MSDDPCTITIQKPTKQVFCGCSKAFWLKGQASIWCAHRDRYNYSDNADLRRQTMKILHVVRQYEPSIGGLESYVKRYGHPSSRQRAWRWNSDSWPDFSLWPRRVTGRGNIGPLVIHRTAFVGKRRFSFPDASENLKTLTWSMCITPIRFWILRNLRNSVQKENGSDNPWRIFPYQRFFTYQETVFQPDNESLDQSLQSNVCNQREWF